jgi:hypothetical protein
MGERLGPWGRPWGSAPPGPRSRAPTRGGKRGRPASAGHGSWAVWAAALVSGGSRRARRADALSIRCSATSKRSGQRCRRWAVRGLSVCHVHGGATKAARAKSDRAVEQLKPAEGARTRSRRDGRDAGGAPARRPARGSRDGGQHGHLGDGRPHVFVSMLREWTSELGRLSKLARDAGIDERRVRMNEAEGHFLASVIPAAVDACSPDDETRAAAIAAAAKLIRERGLHAIG